MPGQNKTFPSQTANINSTEWEDSATPNQSVANISKIIITKIIIIIIISPT
jgi:hypothetical protein